jgi:hypothetical protein
MSNRNYFLCDIYQMTSKEQTINKAYKLFNERKVDELLSLMTSDVHWPNGWEGGYVNGHNEVKGYWTRQWKELNAIVIPVSFTRLPDGRIEVLVKQTVKDLQGDVLFDGHVKHIYSFANELVKEMQIQLLN